MADKFELTNPTYYSRDAVNGVIYPRLSTDKEYLFNNKQIYSNSDDALIKNVSFYKSRGSYVSPTVITTGDYLGEIVGYGYDGNEYRRSGSIRFASTGTIASTRIPSTIEFWTSTNATPSVETLDGYINTNGQLVWNKNGEFLGTYLSSTGYFWGKKNGIATTSTDGLFLDNATDATSIVPVQMSPRARFHGEVWNTSASGSPETSDWIIENLPTSGTTPTSLLKFGYSANGGSYGYPYTFSNLGAFTATLFNGLSIIGGASSVLDIAASKTVNIDNNFNLNGGDVTVVGNGTGNTISFPTGVDTLVGQASIDTLTGLKTLQHNNIVVTSHDGLVFTNDTASTSGVPVQMSPRRRLRANVWNTTATAANNTFDFIDELFPTSGTTPTAVYRLGFSRAGGSYAYPYLFGDTGDISFPLTAGVKLGISATEKIGL